MMFADDLVLVGENLEDVNNRLDEWNEESNDNKRW